MILQKEGSLGALLGGASGIAGAFFIPEVGGKALGIALAAGSILASTEIYYDTYTIETDAKVR